jgi:hypothetical protein
MVLLDKYGQSYLVGNPESPIIASSFSGYDLFPVIEEKDGEVFLFNDQDYSKNGIILKFRKTNDIKQGKLILNGNNTLWFDYLFGEFLKKFGSAYEGHMDKQSKIPTSERLQRLLDSDFPLSIYIKENGSWKLIDYLFTVGPLASRDFVIPVDVSGLMGEEVEIKLESGFMFWELDYAAMDFSENIELHRTQLKPSIALGTGSQYWTTSLAEADGQCMIQEKVGDVTEVIFKTIPPVKNQQQTVFLHTRGYYELIRDFKGVPEITELNKFKVPGYFSDFSRIKYLQFLDKEDEIAGIKKLHFSN